MSISSKTPLGQADSTHTVQFELWPRSGTRKLWVIKSVWPKLTLVLVVDNQSPPFNRHRGDGFTEEGRGTGTRHSSGGDTKAGEVGAPTLSASTMSKSPPDHADRTKASGHLRTAIIATAMKNMIMNVRE